MFIPVDPHQATREQFTANLVDAEVPDSANETWKKYVVPHQKLLDKLAKHEAMGGWNRIEALRRGPMLTLTQPPIYNKPT
jgi:hypothetical protein